MRRRAGRPADDFPMLRVVFGLFVAAFVLFILGQWWSRGDAQRRTIRDMPAGERGALYERVLVDVDEHCGPGAQGLEDWCRDQAEFLSRFPECDDECKAIVGPLRRHATR